MLVNAWFSREEKVEVSIRKLHLFFVLWHFPHHQLSYHIQSPETLTVALVLSCHQTLLVPPCWSGFPSAAYKNDTRIRTWIPKGTNRRTKGTLITLVSGSHVSWFCIGACIFLETRTHPLMALGPLSTKGNTWHKIGVILRQRREQGDYVLLWKITHRTLSCFSPAKSCLLIRVILFPFSSLWKRRKHQQWKDMEVSEPQPQHKLPTWCFQNVLATDLLKVSYRNWRHQAGENYYIAVHP